MGLLRQQKGLASVSGDGEGPLYGIGSSWLYCLLVWDCWLLFSSNGLVHISWTRLLSIINLFVMLFVIEMMPVFYEFVDCAFHGDFWFCHMLVGAFWEMGRDFLMDKIILLYEIS